MQGRPWAWTPGNGLTPYDAIEIARAVNNAHNFNAIGNFTIKDQIPAKWPAAHILAQIGKRLPDLGVLRKDRKLLVNPAQGVIGRSGIVLRDVKPNADEVFFRLLRADDAGHGSSAFACKAAARFGDDVLYRGETPWAAGYAFVPSGFQIVFCLVR